MGKTVTICFTNNKGGSGKSTTCSNLGAAMARAGKKVLLVDGDMQLNLSLAFFPEDWVLEHAQGEKNLYHAIGKQEDLTDYMAELGIRVKYMHSDIDTMERAEIIRDLRLDVFDVLVGINLLREGLDIPEITLVAILDADKEGFLRSERSLIQTIGRAARNASGHVIMYADKITDSMRLALDETTRRRQIQQAYNEEHGITPQTIQKSVRDLISISKKADGNSGDIEKDLESMSKKDLQQLRKKLTKQMHAAAAELNFELAATLRDQMMKVVQQLNE